MSASPEIISAFYAWAAAELSAHHAAPCADEAMDRLTDLIGDRVRELSQLPAQCAEDVILKLFPRFLAENEPKLGQAPLRPVCDWPEGNMWLAHFNSTVADISRFCPEIAAVMVLPNRQELEQAA